MIILPEMRVYVWIKNIQHRCFVKFKILRLHQLVNHNIGVFMYKVFYKDVPKIFNDYFLQNYEIHAHNTRQNDNIILMLTKPTDEK